MVITLEQGHHEQENGEVVGVIDAAEGEAWVGVESEINPVNNDCERGEQTSGKIDGRHTNGGGEYSLQGEWNDTAKEDHIRGLGEAFGEDVDGRKDEIEEPYARKIKAHETA